MPLAIADEVADILVAHPQTAMKMALPAVDAFARATSFDEARSHWERLKRIPWTAWSPEMALEATNAARTNNQLSLCTTPEGSLPDVLAGLLREIFRVSSRFAERGKDGLFDYGRACRLLPRGVGGLLGNTPDSLRR